MDISDYLRLIIISYITIPLSAIHSALIRPGPDLIICDEGHRIKNSHAGISQALKNIRTK